MTRIGLMLFLAFVLPILASCGDGNESNASSSSPPEASAVLQFQSSDEVLTLPSLQVAQNVYTGVTLRLARNGTWQLLSIGPMRPVSGGESTPAVLNAPGTTAIDMNWRPADATITIGRLHIDTKVIGNAALRLAGATWFLGAGSQELMAVTLADFRANPSLAATEAHHVVLQSAPGSGTQRYPLRLSAKVYKFCMDGQDEGADRISLFDLAGNEVFSLKAGDACIDIKPAAGLYTMQHVYGGSGAKRTVFMRPAANPATASPPVALKLIRTASALSAQDAAYPEYWAAYFDNSASLFTGFGVTKGFLSYSQLFGTQFLFCFGIVGAAAQLNFDGTRFFPIARNSQGVPTSLGVPVPCHQGEVFYLTYPEALTLFSPTQVNWQNYVPQTTLSMNYLGSNLFSLQLVLGVHITPLGFSLGNSLNSLQPGQEFFTQTFQAAFRYFSNGLPPSMAAAGGGWNLVKGQVAMFSGTNCTGRAMIAENFNLPSPQPLGDIGWFTGSLQLGLDTALTVYDYPLYGGASRIINDSGCLNNVLAPTGATPGSMQVSIDTATIVVQTNQCEYCNLTGVDLSGLDLSGQGGVKLQHANLAGATINGTNLSSADLRFAILQGANLSRSNLEAANLCSAQLNGSVANANAANLFGAHLKNANLALANLDGVSFNSASFYSSLHQTACQATDCATYAAPTCASAYGASMNNAQFNSAYISNVDMGTVTGAGVDFSGSILVGVSFALADFAHNAATSVSTKFINTYLQGTNFANATLTYAVFTGAHVDLGSTCMQAGLIKDYANFPGYKLPQSTGSFTCVAGTQTAPMCIQTVFTATPAYPVTDCTNTCADGSGGGGPSGGSCTSCSAQSWTGLGNPNVQTSACVAPPAPLCGAAFSSTIDHCW